METTTQQPCPSCDGKGYIMRWRQLTSETMRLRCEHCLETGRIIPADQVMTCTIKEHGGSLFYWGAEWALINPHGEVEGSHERNVVSMFHRAISHGLGYSSHELEWVNSVQDAIDKVVTQGLGEPVTTLPAPLLEHARTWRWPVDTCA